MRYFHGLGSLALRRAAALGRESAVAFYVWLVTRRQSRHGSDRTPATGP